MIIKVKSMESRSKLNPVVLKLIPNSLPMCCNSFKKLKMFILNRIEFFDKFILQDMAVFIGKE